MKKNMIYIIVGLVAVAIAYYFYNKNKKAKETVAPPPGVTDPKTPPVTASPPLGMTTWKEYLYYLRDRFCAFENINCTETNKMGAIFEAVNADKTNEKAMAGKFSFNEVNTIAKENGSPNGFYSAQYMDYLFLPPKV